MGDRQLRRRPPCRNFGGDARSQELARQIVERSGQISALHREQLADIAEFDRAEGWRGDGAVSMIAWVTGQCGVSTSTARQWVRSASNLESLPCLAEGLASGALSLDLVEPLAEVASPSSDAALREASAHWSVRQARELVAWHRAQVESESECRRRLGQRQGRSPRPMLPTAMRWWVGRRPGNSSAAHCGSTTPGGRCGLRSPGTITQWRSRSLVGRVSAQQRDRQRERGPQGRPPSVHDPVGYTPYDQRLYDALLDLFRAGSGPGWGPGSVTGCGAAWSGSVGWSECGGGGAATGGGACAARAAHRLLG